MSFFAWKYHRPFVKYTERENDCQHDILMERLSEGTRSNTWITIKLMNYERSREIKSLFEKYICRVCTAHQPLKAPEGIKRTDSECDRDLEGV